MTLSWILQGGLIYPIENFTKTVLSSRQVNLNQISTLALQHLFLNTALYSNSDFLPVLNLLQPCKPANIQFLHYIHLHVVQWHWGSSNKCQRFFIDNVKGSLQGNVRIIQDLSNELTWRNVDALKNLPYFPFTKVFLEPFSPECSRVKIHGRYFQSNSFSAIWKMRGADD